MRNEENVFIDMTAKPRPRPDPIEEAELVREQRRRAQDIHEQEYKQAIVDIRARYATCRTATETHPQVSVAVGGDGDGVMGCLSCAGEQHLGVGGSGNQGKNHGLQPRILSQVLLREQGIPQARSRIRYTPAGALCVWGMRVCACAWVCIGLILTEVCERHRLCGLG